MRQRHGFSLIELMVSSAVTFLTVLTVSAAFLNYSQSFYTQAGIRGGQASLRQSHLMLVRNLRMAGYGIDPSLAFGFPANWKRDAANKNNLSNRLVFRMRNPSFNAFASSLSPSAITLTKPLRETLRQGQVIQAVCPGALSWTYAQLSSDAPVGSTALSLVGAGTAFPNLNAFGAPCFGVAGGTGAVNIFKIDIYDYSIQFIDGRPFLFRRHGLGSGGMAANAYGEPVAEDIEALRVNFLRADGSVFLPDPTAADPGYDAPVDDVRRKNNNPANIRAVMVGMVARSSTRDLSTDSANVIPPFGGETAPITLDVLTGKPLPTGVRRVVSEMTVQVRNMRSSEMPLPIYSVDTTACKGTIPSDNYNCAGG